jgi:linoleate 10R-lipoxygenase
VRLDRPMENYIHYGVGPHACLGGDASRVALTAMLKTVGRLDHLRRAPGPSGQLKKIPRPGGFYIYMRADHGSYWPFPTSEYRPRPTFRASRADRQGSDESPLGR